MDPATSSPAIDRTGHEKAGLAVLIAGIAMIVGSAGSAITDWVWVVMLVGFLAMVYGIPGVHEYQAPADGAPGKWGALLIRYGGGVVLVLGIVFLIWDALGDPPEEGPGWLEAIWMIGFFAFAIGVILFTVGTLKAKVLPQAAAILMLVGLVAALAIDMATGAFFESEEGGTTEWGFYLGVPVFGLGLAWLGYTVWNASRGTPATDAPATTPPPA